MADLTIDDITRVQIEVMAADARESIKNGSKDPFDVWMVAYEKADPGQREKLMQALSEYNEAMRNGPFGWLFD